MQFGKKMLPNKSFNEDFHMKFFMETCKNNYKEFPNHHKMMQISIIIIFQFI